MMKKTLVAAGVAATAAVLGAFALAGTASASEGTDAASSKGLITRTVHSHAAPSVYSPPVSALQKDQPVAVRCFVEGEKPPGSDNPYWFRITDANGSSFVEKSAIMVPPTTPRC
ncbi:hypothetical protein GCM10009836_13250 [Pseudonocardia ailaonensis]|uniref:Ig-like domain-containing protein n=1 Tax=Pseudonocardia ailaonensis TaxID=367279 RepID=A0ABN2MT42_9PSEU